MKKYIVTYLAPEDATWKTRESTPEEMEEAQSLLAEHPHLSWDATCRIELHEALPVPGN